MSLTPTTAGPAHQVQSAVEDYGFPRGHVGHLTTEEEESFKNFKLMCEEKGYYKPGSEHDLRSHDDATLLRFLRARRFVVPEAYKQFKETEDWRNANEIEKLYETIDLEHYEETRRLYPQWTGRRDRRGIPVYVFEVKHLNSKAMAAYEKSAKNTYTDAKTDGKTSGKLLRLFALYENLTRFTMPLCTALKDRDNNETPITQSNNIVDISGVGLKQFWNLRTHMQDASTLATAHYPETLDRIFIIGAPSFFPTVWGWIKKWFDPITTSKIFILGNAEMKKTLESFIDPANIPKKYGGQLDFEFGGHPVLDPALKDVLKWEGGNTDFTQGPILWVDAEGRDDCGMGSGEMKAVAVGSFNKEARRQTVCTFLKGSGESGIAAANGHAVQSQVNGKGKEPGPESTDAMAAATATAATAGVTAAAVPLSEPISEEPAKTSDPTTTETATSATPTIVEPETENTAESHAMEAGKLVPASRPEPVSFVTATEGLSLSEKAEPVLASQEPHSTTTANPLDPKVNTETAPAVNTETAPVTTSTGSEVVNEKVPENGHEHGHVSGLLHKVADKVGL